MLYGCGCGAAAGTNLVRNPGFEQGGKQPVAWTVPDGLTVFWEDGGVPGKCLHLDTDVKRAEWEAHRRNPTPGRQKTPTSGNKYDTVGATAGVAVYSVPIPVTADAWYRVSFDAKAPGGEPFLYLKGYERCDPEDVSRYGTKIFFQPEPGGASFSLVAMGTSGEEKRRPRPGDYIQKFRRRFVARFPSGGTNAWRRYTGVVHMRKRHKVDAVLLELYAYWPAGDYYFDNICMERISAADAEAFKIRRREQGPTADRGRPLP